MTAVTDDFNRANASDLGPNWQPSEVSPVIDTNTAYGFGSVSSAYRVETFGADQYSQATGMTLGGGATDIVGVTVRHSGSGGGINYYHARWQYNSGSQLIELYKRVAGTSTKLAGITVGVLPVPTDVLRLEAIGSALAVYLNGTLLTGMTATDTSIPSGGAPGLRMNAIGRIDSWAGGDFSPSGPANVSGIDGITSPAKLDDVSWASLTAVMGV